MLAALRQACEKRDLARIDALLDDGVSPNALFDDGQRPIHLTAADGSDHACSMLLQRGADPDLKDADGRSALDLSTPQNIEAAVVLVKYGAAFDPASILGQRLITGFCFHSGSPRQTEAGLRLLLSRGIAADTRDSEGVPAYHHAARHRRLDLCKVLVEHGVDPHCRDAKGQTALHRVARMALPEQVQQQLSMGLDIGALDSHLNTPLHEAARGYGDGNVMLLLSLGADPWQHNADGLTPFGLASTYGHGRIMMLGLALAPDFEQTRREMAELQKKLREPVALPASRIEAALRCGQVEILAKVLESADSDGVGMRELAETVRQASLVAENDWSVMRHVRFQLRDMAQAWMARQVARQACLDALPSYDNESMKP